MLRLEMFGGLTLTGEDRRPIVTQRRRLALLALVAVAGEHGVSRDKLIAYLWPEKPPESARHSLEQLLYQLRGELGDSVFLDASEVRLNADVVSSDVQAFERSLERGALGDAVSAYRGPFLDGFFLSDSLEFERWVDLVRRRLSELCISALEKLAVDAATRAEPQRAVDLWRKRATLDPLSSCGALGLMRAHVNAGDRVAALQYARVYEQLLQQELESAPEPSVAAFVAELRASAGAETTRRAPSEKSIQAVPVNAVNAGRADGTTGAEATRSREILKVRSASRDRRRLLLAGILLLVVTFLMVSARWRSRMGALADGDGTLGAPRIVVLPFGVTSGDSSLVHLRQGMVHLLAQRLTGEGGPVAVDPAAALRLSNNVMPRNTPITTDDAFRIAQQMRAQEILFGQIVTAGQGNVILSGAIISMPSRLARGRASVEGSADSLPRVADRFVADLLAQRAGEPDSRRSALRDAQLPAVRAFLAGRAAHRRGDDDAAIASFGRALAADSTFGLAGLELASAMGWLFRWTVRLESTISGGVRLGSGVRMAGDEETWIRAVDLASRGRERFSAGDLAYLSALRGRHYPRASSAREVLADWERVVRLEPKRAEAWTRLGEVLLQQGFALGLNDAHVRAAALFHKARELDPHYMKPVAWLMELAARSGNTAEVRRLATIYLSHDSVSHGADILRWRVAAALGDVTVLASLRERFDSLDSQTLERIQWSSQVNGIAVKDAERAMSILLKRAGERRERWISLWQAKLLALNSGRPLDALRFAEAKRQVEPDSGLFRWYNLQHAMYWGGDSAAGADAARLLERDASAAVASGRGRSGTRGAYQELSLVAQWRLWRGDTTGVSRTIRNIRRFSSDHPDLQLKETADILAAIFSAVARRDDAPALLERVDSIALQGCCDRPHYIGLVVARLRERAGDQAGALRAIRRGRWFYPPEHLSSYLREEGRLAALTGDRRGAIEAYRHYLALRENPEPALRPERDSIRARVATLASTIQH